MVQFYFLLAAFYLCSVIGLAIANEDKEYWEKIGRSELEEALKVQLNTGVAKNVILFVGDGMGPNTVTATRILRGGESSHLSFENFPHIGLLKTYSVNKQVPDSASTATALFCGVKTNHEMAGVDSTVKFQDCKTSLNPDARLTSIIGWAQEAGKGTGFVTTTRVTHATPSALYSHTAERKWECEATMPPSAQDCKDIARQLIEDYPGKNIQVIMGGGRQCLKSNASSTVGDPVDAWACYRMDGKDLIQEWIFNKEARGVSYKYARKTDDLYNMDFNQTEYLLGIFSNGHMNYEYSRDKTPEGMPSLELMTTSAIKVLLKHDKGFVLMVEGGLIDVAHHRGNAHKALVETLSFNDAINETMNLLEEQGILDETLVIVTSDHSHTLSINGYPERGSNILGIAQNSKLDGVPYTTLSYATSGRKGYHFVVTNGSVEREDPASFDTLAIDYAQQSAILTDENTHGGGDVAVYAIGPMAHLFHNVHEQNYVAAVISYAAKIGSSYQIPVASGCNFLHPVPVLITLLAVTMKCLAYYL